MGLHLGRRISLSLRVGTLLSLAGGSILLHSRGYAEQLKFKLQAEPTDRGLKLTAIPPLGFKVNEKYPNSIRTLEERKVYHPVDTQAGKMVFQLSLSKNTDFATTLAYCSKSICKFDQRILKWDAKRKTLTEQ